jgi:hypothetical protein
MRDVSKVAVAKAADANTNAYPVGLRVCTRQWPWSPFIAYIHIADNRRTKQLVKQTRLPAKRQVIWWRPQLNDRRCINVMPGQGAATHVWSTATSSTTKSINQSPGNQPVACGKKTLSGRPSIGTAHDSTFTQNTNTSSKVLTPRAYTDTVTCRPTAIRTLCKEVTVQQSLLGSTSVDTFRRQREKTQLFFQIQFRVLLTHHSTFEIVTFIVISESGGYRYRR